MSAHRLCFVAAATSVGASVVAPNTHTAKNAGSNLRTILRGKPVARFPERPSVGFIPFEVTPAAGARGVQNGNSAGATRPLAVGGVLADQVQEVTLTEHDHVIEQLSTNGAQPPFRVAVVPWGSRRGAQLFDAKVSSRWPACRRRPSKSSRAIGPSPRP
jgi:hypothetical protein